MGDRMVSVTIRADVSQYKRQLAEAAAETAAFGRATGGLKAPLGNTESQTRRVGNEIDKLSGRLRLATDAALILGPALVPIGAAAVGGLVAMSGQLAATAGAFGVTLLAVQGLGDGLKALDAYQLDPTAAHLQKLRGELAALGPAGRDFVYFLDSIEPQLKALQNTAREGLLPGAETGIKEVLALGTKLRAIIKEISTELGDQLTDAGAALAGPKFEKFFNYLQTDAAPILHDMGHTLGNLTEAAANLFVAFGGVSTDFGGGLLAFSEKLAEASRNLGTNAGFQEFLRYLETEGPHVVETLGSMADAVLQIVEATAPLGGPVLTVLGKVADIFAAIADSDLGTPIFAGLAALALYNRTLQLTGKLGATAFGEILLGERQVTAGLAPAQAKLKTFAADLVAVGRYGSLATEQSARLTKSFSTFGRSAGVIGGLALASSGLADGLSNTASMALLGSAVLPGWGTAVGAAAGYALDFKAANDKAGDSVQALSDALQANQGDFTAQQMAIQSARDAVNAMQDDIKSNSIGEFFKNAFDPDVAVAFTRDALGMKTGPEQLAAAADAAQKELDGLRDGSLETFNPVHALSTAFLDSAAAAKQQAQDLEASVNAMREARQEALRSLDAQLNYQAAIDDASAAIKENGKNFDITTEKGRANRQALYALADGWNQQSDAAKNAKGSLEQARKNFISTAEQMGATAAQAKRLADRLFEIPPKRQTQITLDGVDNAINKAQGLKAILDGLHSKDINIALHYQTIGNKPKAPIPGVPNADGGTVPKTGLGYADRHPYLLADGEEVISNRHGQADRHRSLLKAINAGRMADGGTAGHGPRGYTMFTSPEGTAIISGSSGVAQALRRLQAALAKSEKALDKERQTRDDLQSRYDEIKASVGSAYSTVDPFAAPTDSGGSVWAAGAGGMLNPLAAFDSALATNTANTTAAQAALAAASANGLDGPLYAALAASGNLQLLQAFAGLSATDIQNRENQFAAQSNAQAALGSMAANQQVGPQLAEANKHLDKIRNEVRELRHDVKQADQNNQKSHKQTAKDVRDGVNGAASHGHRRGR